MTISLEVLHPDKEILERAIYQRTHRSGYALVSIAHFGTPVSLSEGEHRLCIADKKLRGDQETLDSSLLAGSDVQSFDIYSFGHGHGGKVFGIPVKPGEQYDFDGIRLTST